MRNDIIRNLVYAQISFFGCLAIAVALTTTGFTNNQGLSFYGAHYPTILPFGLGFVLCDFFLLRAANELPAQQRPFDKLQLLLRIIAALMLAVLLTPDTFGWIFYTAHVLASALLFLLEIGIATWLAWRWNSSTLMWVLLGGQTVAGIVALLSELQFMHYLSQGSLAFQLLFGVLLVWSISQLISQVDTRSPRHKL